MSDAPANDRMPTWAWVLIVAMVCATLLLMTAAGVGFVAWQYLRAPSVPTPAPVVTIDASAPLAADPLRIDTTRQAAGLLANKPYAEEMRDLLWGLAVGFDRSRNTVTTVAQAQSAIDLSGRIAFGGGRVSIPQPLLDSIDATILAAMGSERGELTDGRRAELIATLRALALGADQAAGGG